VDGALMESSTEDTEGRRKARKKEGQVLMQESRSVTFRYHPVGDILYLDLCEPYAEQESDEIEDGVIVRRNPVSGEIENVEILFFTDRMQQEGRVALPACVQLLMRETTQPA
jgi:uncharacterized protein YuzE